MILPLAHLGIEETDLVPQEIPAKDLPEFHRLAERNQLRIRRMLAAFAVIEAAAGIKAGIEQAYSMFGGEKGFSRGRLRAYYYSFKKSDWRVCIDGALEIGAAACSQPAEFLEWLQQRIDSNGRTIELELKKIRDEWTCGKPIPGYGTWQQWFRRECPTLPDPVTCPGYPDGWSTRNLRRKLDASKFRRKAQTLGRTSAAADRPLVYTTRAGLWLASHYQFDDLEHDFFVNTLQEQQAGRPLELFSHDLFSARKCRWGIRVKTMKDDGTANKLTDRMMRMVVAATLFLDGYSPRGTTLVAEHGTAKIPDWMEKILVEASRVPSGESLIRVHRSGFTGAAAHAGQYPGIRKGNPKHKASLESSNRTTHGLTASFPGQTGTNRDRRPEQLAALLDHNDALLAAYAQLPPERAALLQFDLLELNQANLLLADVYAFLERMTDHELEGWENCGHVVQELQLAGRWITQDQLLSLPRQEHEMALALLQAGQLQPRPRKMSRGEVWQRSCADLIRIPGYIVPQILGDDFSSERKVRRHMFEFEDAEVGPGVHRYHSRIQTPDGHHLELTDGETYLIAVNPFAPVCLHVRDAKGRYLGDAPVVRTACRGDVQAVQRLMGAAAKRESELLEPLRVRQEGEARSRIARANHNAAVIGKTTPEDKAITREKNREARTTGQAGIETLLPDAPAEQTTAEYTAPSTTEEVDDLLDQILE